MICGRFSENTFMSNPIYWMLIDTDQTVPEAQGVLSGSEFGKYSAFRFSKRRDEWLLGRWTAKCLAHSLPGYQQYPLDQIEILNTREGAPYFQFVDGTRPGGCLTISHSGHMAVCALTTIEGLRVGADLEKIERASKRSSWTISHRLNAAWLKRLPPKPGRKWLP